MMRLPEYEGEAAAGMPRISIVSRATYYSKPANLPRLNIATRRPSRLPYARKLDFGSCAPRTASPHYCAPKAECRKRIPGCGRCMLVSVRRQRARICYRPELCWHKPNRLSRQEADSRALRSQGKDRVIMATTGTPESAIDGDLGERYYKNDEALEQKLTSEIVAVIVGFVERRFFAATRICLPSCGRAYSVKNKTTTHGSDSPMPIPKSRVPAGRADAAWRLSS